MKPEHRELRNRVAEGMFTHLPNESVESSFRGADRFISELERREAEEQKTDWVQHPPDNKFHAKEQKAEEPKGRSLCTIHPSVDYRRAWGCPECLAELRAENERLKVKTRLHEAAEKKWLPCPDHRDKLHEGCYVCENERLKAERERGWEEAIIFGIRYCEKSEPHRLLCHRADFDLAINEFLASRKERP